MKTPRLAAEHIHKIGDGFYSHFGIVYGIKPRIKNIFHTFPKKIKINVHIDGIPLTSSSKSDFWCILASICVNPSIYTEPFVIGIYHGKSKPANSMSIFVNEMKEIEGNGIEIDEQLIHISINAILCDTPARSYICKIKGHNAYEGCSKCIQEGDFIENRMTFPEIESTLRTDECFRKKQYSDHHTGVSCLEELAIDMVKQFPLDSLHLVYLGNTKRLIQFWYKGSKNIRLAGNIFSSINNKLILMSKFISQEFARKPRSITDIDRWKETELRQFLLYTGPIILLDDLPQDMYIHFLSLSISIRILSDEQFSLTLHEYANKLLKWFVSQYGKIYGNCNIIYNVHNLIHLADDVKNFGPLENFSCFKYESYLGKLKSRLRVSSKPLHQIINRIIEQNVVNKNKTFINQCMYVYLLRDSPQGCPVNSIHFSIRTIIAKSIHTPSKKHPS